MALKIGAEDKKKMMIAAGLGVVVLALVGYALFEMTPLASHVDRFRDPRTGKRRWESPRLD